MPGKNEDRRYVFLNIPYDSRFERLCIAYICGIAAFGLVPRATLEIPGNRRLDRIVELIRSCPFSVHDLSRVQSDRNRPRTPRFNMPFELGLAVAHEKLTKSEHSWFVFETMSRRADKSLSDLAGTDIYIHQGTVHGVLQQISNAFIRQERQPSLAEMNAIYRYIRKELPSILRQSGSTSVFDGARPFRDVSIAASLKAEERV